jgi:hypothetical protein
MPSWAGSKAANESLSITESGWTRPPMPITVGAMVGFPPVAGGSTTVVGPVISVIVRLVLEAPPARNSATVPLTRTASPTLTDDGADDVKTRIASEVFSFASGVGSCT